jgi:1-acyl-sn-glycerol-3-phosphate acyltransferase
MNELEKMGPGARLVRAFRRGAVALFCVAACLAEYCVRAARGRLAPLDRAAVLQKWSARLLSGIGVEVAVEGQPPQRGLIVSNHLSYLDILVFSAVARTAFVSKREVKSWPGVGWIAALGGTIFIDRSRKSDTHAIQPQIQEALSNGIRLVIFPEGTSTDGSRLLHFHSSLFQPALDLSAPVTAAHLSYFIPDGDAATEACYWGEMTLLPHVLNLLTKHSVHASVRFSQEHLQFSDRKEAARTMQERVEALRLQASCAVAQLQRP